MDATRPEVGAAAPRESPGPLLVITYHYPPEGAVGALRWGGITKYLAREGWDVTVLASGRVARPAVMNGVRVHSVPRLRTLNDAYRALKPSSLGSETASAGNGGPGEEAPGTPTRPGLRRTLAAYAAYPGHARGWLFRAALNARRIIAREGVTALVTSGPPHIAHTAGLLATIGTNVRWSIDLRDPWSTRFGSETPESLVRVTRRLERMAFDRADRLIANTEQFTELLRRENPSKEVVWVPNGVDLEDLPDHRGEPGGPVTVAYAGTLYLNRNLGPVLEAMHRIMRTGSPAGAIRLRFAGHSDAPHIAELRRRKAELGLPDECVEIMGSLPREEARAMVRDSHLALVLAQEQPLQVPAKLYELVGMGVPTLVLTEPGSASASEAERIGAFWKDPGDTAGIAGLMQRVADGRMKELDPPAERFDYEHIADRVGRLLSPRSP